MADGKNIKEMREYYIIKGNELVRYAKYKYTAQQLKIYNYAVSKIKRNDKPGQWYDLSIDELCKICNWDIDNGKIRGGAYYRNIKRDLAKLTERRWVELPEIEMTLSVLSDAVIIPLSGTVQVKFHEAIEPFLFEQVANYTQYKLTEILCFHSKYSIRLYELLRGYITRDDIENEREIEHRFKLQELRELLNVEGYAIFTEFERNVLKVAKEEINTYSDTIRIDYDVYKSGKTVTSVNFIINYPRDVYIAHQETHTSLNTGESKARKREARQTIKGWREVHPDGSKNACIKETGLTYYLVTKYWDTKNQEEREQLQAEIDELKTEISKNDKEIEKLQKRRRTLETKAQELETKAQEIESILNEEKEKALQAAQKVNKAEGEEKQAAQAELQALMDNLKEIAAEYSETLKKYDKEIREIEKIQ